MVAGNLFIDSLFSLLFAFFSRMGECLSRLFFKSVRCQTKVNFSLRSVWCWFEFKYSFFLCNLWLFLFSHSSIFFVLKFPFYYLIIVWKHSLRNNFYRSTFCWRFTAENLKILSVLGGCHFFLETRIGGVIPPNYARHHQKKSLILKLPGGRIDGGVMLIFWLFSTGLTLIGMDDLTC